ncbi:MAG TPA: pyridoxamine 5'-phosphate oxidase family protein [Candidatus Saccharimonadales bacterium]|nr:pyridoxamine 5'-phosphate oxidase family protein [Candidatus Saccharimonadales bacterium]
MTTSLTAQQQRIKKELAAAGMTTYGQFKMSSRHLPKILEEDEHIGGVVYGHCGIGLAMLVATTKRVVYLERRPLFTSMDDIAYDVIAGVQFIDAGVFPALNLHTRMGDYRLTYVNPRCAGTFARYIEDRLEHKPLPTFEEPSEIPPESHNPMTPAARKFLNSREVAVLSTTDRTGNVEGATIYYILGTDDKIYILTKSDTAKAHNMLANHQVALTVFDADEAKTAQIGGYAEIEADIETKRNIFERLVRPRNYDGDVSMPPLTQLDTGGFIAFRITPTFLKYTDYKHSNRITPSHSA